MTIAGSDVASRLSRRFVLQSSATSGLGVFRVTSPLGATPVGPATDLDILARQNDTPIMSLPQQASSDSSLETDRGATMLATAVIDRTTAEIATWAVARLSVLRVPQLERVACHRDGDWVTVWLVCSEYPIENADAIYAIESDLVLAFSDVYISLQVVSRYGQDVSALASIPEDSLSLSMAA